MKVGNRKCLGNENVYQLRSKKSISYAINIIKNSPIAPYVQALYLYGSCARGEQTYKSDVDLFMVLSPDFDSLKYKNDVILLKSVISPTNLEMAEVDLKVVIGDSWKSKQLLYYQNIRLEGIDIWKTN